VAAVTNARGFGVLGAVAHTPKQLEIDLAWIEEEVGGRPFGVDLLLPQKYEGADEGGLDRDSLRQLLRRSIRPSSTTSWLGTKSRPSTLISRKRCRESAT
jgi:hypothetical protein